MESLSDDVLLETYFKAQELNLHEEFILSLKVEEERRNLN